HGSGGHPRAARARPAHLSALPGGTAGGGQPGRRHALHRLHRHPRGAGPRHRGALRLVPWRGSRPRAAADQREKPRPALQGRLVSGPRAQLAPDAAQGVPRHDHARLRGARPITTRERAGWALACVPPLAVLGFVFLWPVGVSLVASLSLEGHWSLANYERVWRLYARDVLYTVGVAAAGSALTF